MCQCDQRFRAENQAPISKNIGRRFKNTGGATDRFQKSDNVEIDDSAKIAGRETGPAQPFDRMNRQCARCASARLALVRVAVAFSPLRLSFRNARDAERLH